MARLPRLSPIDSPVHVLQRGNNRQAVFRADEDYAFYLDTLRMAAREHDFAIHAFALMPNHVHLVGTPKVADSLSRTLQAVGRRYTRYFNAAAGRSGTLWEGRFRSTVLDPAEWVLPMILYVEGNAVRAGLAVTPEEGRWSTYRHHVGIQSIPWVSDHYCYWRLGNTPFERQSRYRTLWHEGSAPTSSPASGSTCTAAGRSAAGIPGDAGADRQAACVTVAEGPAATRSRRSGGGSGG